MSSPIYTIFENPRELSIHSLVVDGNIDGLRRAINANMSVDTKNLKGQSPLHLAASRGNFPAVKILLDAYLWNINGVDVLGESAVFKAIKGGHTQICRYLINHGAKIHKNYRGQSLLRLSVDDRDLASLEFVLKNGLFDEFDVSLILKSPYRKYLLKLIKSDSVPQEKVDMVCWVCFENSYYATAMFLMNFNVNVNYCDGDGYSTLHLAACNCRDKELIRKVLKKGTDIECENCNRDTPLHCAASFGNLVMVKRLIECGADPTKRNNGGLTPIELSEINCHEEVVKYLGSLEKS